MFGRSRKDEPSIYDEPIDKVLDKLQTYSTEDAEFSDAMEYLERLMKLRAEERKSRFDPNTILIVAGNLLGILVIVAYEQKHVMTSKATQFIMKVK